MVQAVNVVVLVWHDSHAAAVGIWPVAGFAFTSLYAPPWQVEQPDVIPAWFMVHVVKVVVLV